MLSAHQPYARFPDLIKEAARAVGRLGPGRGRRSGDVRRRHPGRERDGAFPFLARRHRSGDRGCSFPRHVRRGGLSRRLRQDRAGPVDRRAGVWPFAGGVPARGTHAFGPWKHREVESPSALRRGQGDPRRVAGGRSRGLSRARHVHLLRHREHQPDADGDHGPASAGRFLRQSQHAAPRRADHARRQAGAGDHRARQSIRADRARDRRAGDRQWRRRASCDGRLDQSHHSPGGDGGRRWDCAQMGGFRRSCGSDAASRPDLSEREGRRESFPRRGRHGPLDPRASRAPGSVHGDAQTVWGDLDDYAVEPRLDAEGAVAWSPAAPSPAIAASCARRAIHFRPTADCACWKDRSAER